MLTVGSLFAGIGGFDLGLERAGMRSVWQCEIDPYCQRVLAKHWPDVLRVPDVRGVGAGTVPWVDVIAGGFPCKDLSRARFERKGLDGEQSGLWSEMFRIVRELRPRYVVVENVPELLADGMGRVLGDLASLGFDAEWDVLPASAFGAPHRRERIWLVAHPHEPGLQGAGGSGGRVHLQRTPAPLRRDWPSEPELPRVANGIPRRLVLEPIRALGNALVPLAAEWIGRRIIDYEGELADAA